MVHHTPLCYNLFYDMLIIRHELALRAEAVFVEDEGFGQSRVEFRAVEPDLYGDGVVVRVHHVHLQTTYL